MTSDCTSHHFSPSDVIPYGPAVVPKTSVLGSASPRANAAVVSASASRCPGHSQVCCGSTCSARAGRCGHDSPVVEESTSSQHDNLHYTSDHVETPSSTQFLALVSRRFASTLRARNALWKFHTKRATCTLNSALAQFGIQQPAAQPQWVQRDGRTVYLLDRSKQSSLTLFLRRSQLSLPNFVRLLRGETVFDSRPNKALEVPSHLPCWSSFRYRTVWESFVREGVRPKWIHPLPPHKPNPKNHGSAARALNSIVKNIRKGQDAGQYLVLDIDILSELDGITCSPFGAVPKGTNDLSVDARIIHDLSFPHGSSINDHTAPTAAIEIAYDGAQAIAARILHCYQSATMATKMMTGDVNGAFRHVPIHAEHVGRFAGTIPELGVLIIDLSCPFGWTESPACYWVAGSAINHIYSHSAPAWPQQPLATASCFDGKAWCDDHICVEEDAGTRIAEAATELRSAMVCVLGPTACNEDKFSPWFTKGKALGLIWDTVELSVAMPQAKIDKARHRIQSLLEGTHTTRTELMKLLGSLRHVGTCVRAAIPFFQRVMNLLRDSPRFGVRPISPGCRDDLRWFLIILRSAQLHSIPLERFTGTQEPTVHIYMDASDVGLCALFPARKEYCLVKFDDDELAMIREQNHQDLEFGINIRELMSAVFASIVWGHRWHQVNSRLEQHVRFWIDNTTAVAWNNRRSTRNTFGQLLLRLLALQEAQYNFYATASHIPGANNEMADAGSRVWHSLDARSRFTDLSYSWSQVEVPHASRKLSQLWDSFCDKQR